MKFFKENKLEDYKDLITTCKSYGINVTEEEKRYLQIINDAKEYLEEKKTQFFSELSIKTQYGLKIENCIN